VGFFVLDNYFNSSSSQNSVKVFLKNAFSQCPPSKLDLRLAEVKELIDFYRPDAIPATCEF